LAKSKIEKWGNGLAVRLPLGIAEDVGLTEGESVEVIAIEESITICRSSARERALAEAQTAMAEITADAKGRSLGGLSTMELINGGRRG
jgi:antitoxin component of MazEF toxin-antitoxin module